MKKAEKDRFASMGPMQQIPKKLGQSMNDNSETMIYWIKAKKVENRSISWFRV